MSLAELQSSLQSVTSTVGPLVVGIGQRWGRGSGLVVAAGKVVTNAHNLRGEETTVTFSDGRSVSAMVEGVDADGDVAVLSVDTAGVPTLEWGSPDDVALGSAVIALSNAGGRGLRATMGFVSSTARTFRGPRGRRITGSIEHTAPLVRGSSGGPIVNEAGRLLGINTNRLGEGFYLAIPADQSLRDRIDALGRGESPKRVRLGVGIAPPHIARRLRQAVGLPEAEGLLVRLVEEDGPAARAGLQEGDLIVSVAGRAVAGADELYEALDGLDTGSPVAVKLLRGADEKELQVTLGD